MRKDSIKRCIVSVIIVILLISIFGITVSKPQNNLKLYNKQNHQNKGFDYWVQTTDEDFNKGTKYNINVSNDAFHLNENTYITNQTILGPESFEGVWPPNNWSSKGGWNKENNRAHTGEFSADFDGNIIGKSGILFSPFMNTSNSSASAINVEFWTFSEGADLGEYYLDYYDGNIWNTITRLDNIGQGKWAKYTENVTDSKYFTSDFGIRWRVVGLDLFEHVYVDDVKVTLEKQNSGYVTYGSLISQAHDTGVKEPVYQNLIIDSDIPNGTAIESWVRAAETESGLESAIWYSNIAHVPNLQWVQWRINLTGDKVYTPTVYQVNISWFYEDLPVPDETYVDDDYDENTPGWGYDHFDNIQDGVNAVNSSGTVNIYSGTYYENVVISRSMTLIGENKHLTIVDGNFYGSVLSIINSIVTISGLKIQNSGSEIINSGILVVNAEVTLSSLIIQNNNHGIILLDTKNSEIFLNNITDNSNIGIALEINSNNNWIAGNKIINNYFGIYLNNTFDNEISEYQDGTMEIWNQIEYNNYGIYSSDSSNNIIYHNNFQENDQNAYDSGSNYWDNGERGNYWDDYAGEDTDGNGIGDTPHPIPGGSNQDNYPVMVPNGQDLEPPEVYIIKPEDGYLYVNIVDIVIFQIPLRLILINTLIVGKIDIEVNALDNLSGIEKVEFYIDDKLKGEDKTEPYSWTWDEKVTFFPYTIKVTAYDKGGNQNSDIRTVWKVG